MTTIDRRRRIAAFAAAVLLLGGACSSDDDSTAAPDEGVAASADDVLPEEAGESPSDSADNGPDAEDAEGTDDEAPAPAGSKGFGRVSIGSTLYRVDLTVQCSIFPGDVVSIAGVVEDDPSIEVVFDVFEPGDQKLRVTGPDFEWTSTEPDFELVINDPDVSGSADLQSSDGESELGLYSFSCN